MVDRTLPPRRPHGSTVTGIVPWEQALRTRFDLALAAGENDDLHLLEAPIILLPHVVGFQKFYPDTPRS